MDDLALFDVEPAGTNVALYDAMCRAIDAAYEVDEARYPTARSARSDEPEYVLLEHLTDVDLEYNVARLRAEAIAKQKHADTLNAYRRSRALRA